MKFFKKTKKLSHRHLLEITASCAGAMLLIFAALFISNGGLKNLNGELSYLQHINPQTLTATIFPCGWFGYCYGSITLNPSISVSNAAPTPGSAVTVYPSISVSGANAYCAYSLWGGEYGAGPGQYGTGGDMLCYCYGGDQDGSVLLCQYATGSSCDSSSPAYTSGTTAMSYSYGGSGTYPWTTLPLTQGGTTYTVYADCTAANVGYVQAAASATITPVNPPPACPVSSFSSPWNSNSYLIYSGGQGSINNWYGRYCVTNYSGSAIFIPMATPTEWNDFSARASAIGIGISAY